MVNSGNIYGVVLNDRDELSRLGGGFIEKPYLAPPRAPVVYMKSRTTLSSGQALIRQGEMVVAASTLAVLFARDASRVRAREALGCLGACALAIDLSYPEANYYRPAIAQRNADGFLVMGAWGAPAMIDKIDTSIDGEIAHSWSLGRLRRPVVELIADLSEFMTLRAGDVLLAGLPGDAPRARAGQVLSATAQGLGSVRVEIEGTAE